MSKRVRTDDRRGATPEQRFDWFKTSASQPTECDEWDIKTEPLAAAILGLLSLGKGIQFGATRDGSSLYITIYDGDTKSREFANDSIDFDDAIAKIVEGVVALKTAESKGRLRAVGD